MPQSHVFAMDDPALYRAKLRAGEAEMLVTGKGSYEAELVRIDLQGLWMQRSSDSLPHIIHAAHDPRRAAILFLTRQEHASIQHDGAELGFGELAFYKAGATSHHRSMGACEFGTMSLTPDDLAAAAEALVGRELVTPAQTRVIRPPRDAMARLLALHGRAVSLAKQSPSTLSHPATAKALEQELVHAMVSCLGEDTPKAPTGSRRRRIMTRFEDCLRSQRYEPVYLAEICRAIGVSERTLRTCCNEYLGMGPIHYLWLRRLHLAHRALLNADPASASVTEIATRYGFWELGRFSMEHRSLFGEPPSASLQRAAN